ncbi:hypothetical protein [Actinocrispum wychmicini]|uniref:Uncharacterized protein n=1 Tax=Actinocrispum wychmicini TaxID=1213861 RepID=A0A4R2JTP9_9PSEU|nr:hypothetical protein [Actinocrispum wychmicini]TCO62547.1 hypothetical protein EV192_102686 [Actinocrispum wychmicini]
MNYEAQRLLHALEVFADSLRGGKPRRLAGMLLTKVGGPVAVARLFRPVSPNGEYAAQFRARHEAGMRAEVLRSVQRALETWDRPLSELDQADFDARFVALAHLPRFLDDHAGEPGSISDIGVLAKYCLALHDNMASAWLQRTFQGAPRTSD